MVIATTSMHWARLLRVFHRRSYFLRGVVALFALVGVAACQGPARHVELRKAQGDWLADETRGPIVDRSSLDFAKTLWASCRYADGYYHPMQSRMSLPRIVNVSKGWPLLVWEAPWVGADTVLHVGSTQEPAPVIMTQGRTPIAGVELLLDPGEYQVRAVSSVDGAVVSRSHGLPSPHPQFAKLRWLTQQEDQKLRAEVQEIWSRSTDRLLVAIHLYRKRVYAGAWLELNAHLAEHPDDTAARLLVPKMTRHLGMTIPLNGRNTYHLACNERKDVQATGLMPGPEGPYDACDCSTIYKHAWGSYETTRE